MQENPVPEMQEEAAETLAAAASIPAAADESPPSRSPHSLPHFLKKVYRSELKDTYPSSRQLLIIAVHSVFLESGFIAFDPTSKMDNIRLPEGWASTLVTSTVRIRYALPALVNSECNSSVETAILNFQFLGDSVAVYGCLSSNGSDLLRVFLDASRFVPLIECVLKSEGEGNLEAAHERVVFEFWKVVKDGLSLPLLVSLCEKTGLPSPPCFMVLPIDVKVRILDSLPGVDIARAACVCSELRYLASSDDLWRNKFREEFGELGGAEGLTGRWRQNFAARWERMKRQKLELFPERHVPAPFPRHVHPRFGSPGFSIIGGDYDLLPHMGGPFLSVPHRHLPRFPTRRKFSPYCNVGGFNFNL